MNFQRDEERYTISKKDLYCLIRALLSCKAGSSIVKYPPRFDKVAMMTLVAKSSRYLLGLSFEEETSLGNSNKTGY